MQTEPGSIPGSGEDLAKFSRNCAELYWDFNESIPRPLGGQEVPEIVSSPATMVYVVFLLFFFFFLKWSPKNFFLPYKIL